MKDRSGQCWQQQSSWYAVKQALSSGQIGIGSLAPTQHEYPSLHVFSFKIAICHTAQLQLLLQIIKDTLQGSTMTYRGGRHFFAVMANLLAM